VRPDRLVAPALGALWTHRGRLPFAWDVLKHGACADCSLGTAGLQHTAPGQQLCARRLDRLDRQTAPAFSPRVLAEVAPLKGLSPRALRGLGRIPAPLLRRAGQTGFAPLSWTDATALVSARLRDERAQAAWGLRVDPLGMDLESLFQLGRFVAAMERRERGDLPPLVDLAVPTEERALRARARDTRGVATSSTSSVDLAPGDRALVVSDGDQPLLDDLLAFLRERGVLVQQAGATDPWPDDVRATLLFGRAGTVTSLAAGLPLATENADLAPLSAAYLVGERAGREVTGLERVPFRVHQAAFLDPSMLDAATEAVLLVPASTASATPGGGTHISDELVARFAPPVVGAPRSEARPHWEIPVLVAAHASTDLGDRLAVHDSAELRAALARERPGLAGVLDLAAPGDGFRLPSPLP